MPADRKFFKRSLLLREQESQPDEATMLSVCRSRAKFLTGSWGETYPATDPEICKYMERTGIEPATSWLQIKT